MKELKNNYYIRLSENSEIVKMFSSVYERPKETDILVGSGFGAQFKITENVLHNDLKQYANIENGLPLINEQGIYQLKYENGLITKISDQELQKEIDNLQKAKSKPSEIEILKQSNLTLMENAAIQFEENLLLKEKLAQQELKIEEQDEKLDNVMLGMTAMFEKGL